MSTLTILMVLAIGSIIGFLSGLEVNRRRVAYLAVVIDAQQDTIKKYHDAFCPVCTRLPKNPESYGPGTHLRSEEDPSCH